MTVNRLARQRCGAPIAPYLLMAPALVLVAVFLYGVVNGVLQGFGIMPFISIIRFHLQYWAEALTRSDLAASVGLTHISPSSRRWWPLASGIVLSAALCAVRRTRLLSLIDVQIPLMCAHILVVLAAVSLFSGSLCRAFRIRAHAARLPLGGGRPGGAALAT